MNKQSLFGQYTGTTIDTNRFLGLMRKGYVYYDEWLPSKMYLCSAEKTVLLNQTYVVVLTRDGNSRSIHLDGKLMVADDEAECYAGNKPCHWWIGGRKRASDMNANEFFNGDISEFIVFTRALSESTRENVESYLMDKYIHHE